MKLISKILAAASLAGATVAAAPLAAQVSGNVAVVNAPVVIAQSNALNTGFQQIGTTYASQIQQIQQKQQQAQALLQQLDTNSDGNLDQTERQAAQTAPQTQQLQTLEREIAQLTNQIDTARVYVIQQILAEYGNSLQTVATADNIQFILSPDALAYANPAANINTKVVTALNTRVPSVQITPPQGYQPSQQAVAVYQQVEQILMVVAARQQQAAQQQQQPAQSTGR